MSYSVYVNESYIDDLANIGQWDEFLNWAAELDLKGHEKIVKLSDHGYISRPSLLRAELEAAVKAKEVPRNLRAVVKRLIAASNQLNGEPDEESILFVTDGVNGLINDVIPADDPDHSDNEAEGDDEDDAVE